MKYLPLVLSLVIVLGYGCQKKATENPNILFLFVDDLGYHDLSGHGSAIFQTPNVDKLATESVVFSNAYSNYPRCVPSRYALLTGTYPVVRGEVPDDGFQLTEVQEDRNFIRILKKAGYRTAFFGKWHLGDGETSPSAFGYDLSVAAGKAGSPISYFYPFNTPKGANKKVNKAPIEGLDEKCSEGDYLTDVLTNEVMDFIKDTPRDQPFLAMLSFYAVHQPLEAKQEGIDENRKEIAAHDFGDLPEYVQEGTGRTKMRQDNAAYAAMVENMDWNVGRLLSLLNDLEIADNTLILFSSDHGGLSNDGTKRRNLATSNYPLRAGKGWMYEGGTRVPLYLKYGKAFSARQDTQSIVMLMDVFPTLTDLVTQQPVMGVDGKSFLPILKNEETWDGRTVFWHATSARPANTGESKSSAIRSGDWKLIHFYEKGEVELYQLKQDPSETNNLVGEYPEIAQDLLARLNSWKGASSP